MGSIYLPCKQYSSFEEIIIENAGSNFWNIIFTCILLIVYFQIFGTRLNLVNIHEILPLEFKQTTNQSTFYSQVLTACTIGNV